MRNNLLYDNKAGHKKYVQYVIENYNKSNKLLSYSINNLNDFEKPLIINSKYQPKITPVKYENKQIFKLTDFFEDYFEDITLDRTEDVFIHYDYTYIDELEIPKIPEKKITLQMDKKNGSQKYFTVNYSEVENDKSYLFTRTIKINKNHIPKEQIKDFYNDCVKLNEIKNSTVIIE